MPDVIRLDRSKPFSTCHGERTPDDPHYRVHFWQAYKVGSERVMLPFDSQDLLVPDDGRTEPYQIMIEGKPQVVEPLYTDAMRRLVERLKSKKPTKAEKPEIEVPVAAVEDEGDDVNLAAWLRGETSYTPQEVKKAAKARFKKNYVEVAELVTDLVLDEKLVPEDQVCPTLAKYLPPKQ